MSFLTVLNDRASSVFLKQNNKEMKTKLLEEWIQNIKTNQVGVDDGIEVLNYKDGFSFSDAYDHILRLIFLSDGVSEEVDFAKGIIFDVSDFLQLFELLDSLKVGEIIRTKKRDAVTTFDSEHFSFQEFRFLSKTNHFS